MDMFKVLFSHCVNVNHDIGPLEPGALHSLSLCRPPVLRLVDKEYGI